MNFISSKQELLETVSQIHFDCHELVKQVFGQYYPVAGNIGVFCHLDEEYEVLTELRKEMTTDTGNPNQKYYPLGRPIIISAKDDVPDTTYTHLYIRKPDSSAYGEYLGDVDFVLSEDEYTKIKNKLLAGRNIKGAKIYDRPGWDTIEISDPEINSIAFLSTKEFSERVRVKFTADTNL